MTKPVNARLRLIEGAGGQELSPPVRNAVARTMGRILSRLEPGTTWTPVERPVVELTRAA